MGPGPDKVQIPTIDFVDQQPVRLEVTFAKLAPRAA